MWGGRFSRPPAQAAEEFSRSLHFDSRLAPFDIAGSLGHARALRRAGVLSAGELAALEVGLAKLARLVVSGKADFATGEEDVHSWVENRLRELVGEPADKLHTGRSRNDQVALDARLWLRAEIEATLGRIRALNGALLDLAGRHATQLFPGHTHFQPAQPVLLAHHLLAYVEMLLRDAGRFRGALARTAVLTTGSGALAGTSIPLDRRAMARELELPAVSANSLDAVSDRDFVAEFVFCAALTMTHLSRFAEELIIWSHPALGWAEIGDEYCTGSSLMPQKKNPDMAELVRGKTGRVTGHLVGLLTLLKGLPLAYNRDLQEDKEALFDAADTLRGSLEVMTGVVGSLSFRPERLEAAAAAGFSAATDLAEYLALAGVPFRQAHHVVGRIVRHCIEGGKDLPDLTLEELRGFSPKFGPDALRILTAKASVSRKRGPGSTAPAEVRKALREARARNR
ncbi:MAG TPA: argininosuccinate lyase [bacterium]